MTFWWNLTCGVCTRSTGPFTGRSVDQRSRRTTGPVSGRRHVVSDVRSIHRHAEDDGKPEHDREPTDQQGTKKKREIQMRFGNEQLLNDKKKKKNAFVRRYSSKRPKRESPNWRLASVASPACSSTNGTTTR